MRWEAMELSDIVNGKSDNDVSFLLLFLKDYSDLTSIENLCVNCNGKVQGYLNHYKQLKQPQMNSQYKLYQRFENLPLRNVGEGYNINVNNINLTDEYAVILMERYDPKLIFEKFPKVIQPKVIQTKKQGK